MANRGALGDTWNEKMREIVNKNDDGWMGNKRKGRKKERKFT